MCLPYPFQKKKLVDLQFGSFRRHLVNRTPASIARRRRHPKSTQSPILSLETMPASVVLPLAGNATFASQTSPSIVVIQKSVKFPNPLEFMFLSSSPSRKCVKNRANSFPSPEVVSRPGHVSNHPNTTPCRHSENKLRAISQKGRNCKRASHKRVRGKDLRSENRAGH